MTEQISEVLSWQESTPTTTAPEPATEDRSSSAMQRLAERIAKEVGLPLDHLHLRGLQGNHADSVVRAYVEGLKDALQRDGVLESEDPKLVAADRAFGAVDDMDARQFLARVLDVPVAPTNGAPLMTTSDFVGKIMGGDR